MANFFRGQFLKLAPHFSRENFLLIVLLAGLLVFQLILRFQGLYTQPMWHDEAATMYFSHHLNEVFLEESHSLFYYSIFWPLSISGSLEVGDFRLYQGLISWFLSILILFRSSKLFETHEWFFFNSLYGIHPLVFGFSRLIRPYSLVIDLTALMFLESRLNSRKGFFLASLFLSLIYPLAVVPPFIEVIFSQKRREKLKLALFATLPIFVYYLLKSNIEAKMTGYISWIRESSLDFLFRFNGSLFGLEFPLNNLPTVHGSVIMFIVLIFLVEKLLKEKNQTKKSYVMSFFISYFSIVIFSIILTPLINLKIVRYYVFILPYLLVAFTALIPKPPKTRNLFIFLMASLALSFSFFNRPYFKMDRSLGVLNVRLNSFVQSGSVPVLVCGPKYLQWFFKSQGYLVCDSRKDIDIFKKSHDGIFVPIHDYYDPIKGMFKDRTWTYLDSYDVGSIFFLAGNP